MSQEEPGGARRSQEEPGGRFSRRLMAPSAAITLLPPLLNVVAELLGMSLEERCSS